MKDMSAEELIRTYLKLVVEICKSKLMLKCHIMDNKVSKVLKEAIEYECKLELVPSGCHICSVAEVAMRTFKNHVIVILVGLPDFFLL